MSSIAIVAVTLTDVTEAFEVARDAYVASKNANCPVAIYIGSTPIIVKGEEEPHISIPRASQEISLARLKEKMTDANRAALAELVVKT